METTREDFEWLKKQPFHKLKVITNSMEPVIMVGESIVIVVGTQDIKRFDIVVFFKNGKLICHYLWSVNKKCIPVQLQTRNIPGHLDSPFSDEDCLGKVISHKLSFWQKLRSLFQ